MSIFVSKVQARLLKLNKNWLCVICGEPGSGKSYSGIAIAQKIYPEFSIENVIFTPKEFLEKLNNKKLIKKGAVFIFDEAGVGLSARDWYSIQNKLLGAVLQIFRALNIGVIFTTPNLSYIDVQARKLFHNYVETLYIDRFHDEVVAKIYDIQHNSRYDKTYFKLPTLIDSEGKHHTYNEFRINKPSDNIIKDYEERKNKYVTDNLRDAMSSINGEKDKPKGRVHQHSWQGRDKTNDWICKNCRTISKQNPYMEVNSL